MDNYLIFGEIQEWLTTNYKKYGRKFEVQEAIRDLSGRGRIHQGVPRKPDFQKWDFGDDSTLVELMHIYPIFIRGADTSAGFPLEHLVNPDMKQKDFFITLAHFYAKNEYRANDTYSLIYALHGSSRIYIQDREYNLETGDLYMLSPNTLFSVTAMPGDLVFFISIEESLFSTAFMDLIYKNFGLSSFFRMLFQKGQNNFFAFYILPDHEVRYLLQHLLMEFLTYDKYADEMSMSYTKILFSTLLRRQCQKGSPEADSSEAAAKLRIFDILRYIEKHFADITLTDLCRQFHYSESYVSRMIRSTTGKSFSAVVTEFRMIQAQNYLSETDLSIGEIALEVGYNSFEHFSRCFKKNTGISPREYRKRLSGLSGKTDEALLNR